MSRTMLPFSALCPPKDNPRKSVGKSGIAGLAQSIKEDGILQNLVVIPEGDGQYRVHIGKRRYLALKLLKRNGDINDEYKVPVVIKKNLEEAEALRIATVENVQREPLDPIDEADAFASLLQNGATLEAVAVQTGVSEHTVRRRLALANLSKNAKQMVRSGSLPLGVAEALTLGTVAQQQLFLDAVREGAEMTKDQVRDALLSEKPAVSLAIFPKEQYTGSYTTDLFGDDGTTLFDDVEQFMQLQEEAVAALAEKHRKKASFVDVLNAYTAPWWQYREAEDGEKPGVVINLSPSGVVEVRKGLVKHQVAEDVVDETMDTPMVPKVRSEYGPSLCRYAAHEKSIAVLGALMGNRRKMLEVAATLLLTAHLPGSAIRIEPHSCVRACDEIATKPKGYMVLMERKAEILSNLGLISLPQNGEPMPFYPFTAGHDEQTLYRNVQYLSDEALILLVALLPLCTFGQKHVDVIETTSSLFSEVARDLSVSMRDWWTPHEQFLIMLRRSQLEAVAAESGASLRMARLDGYKKKELVELLTKHFERTVCHTTELDEFDQKGRDWLPAIMAFEPSHCSATDEAA